MRTKHKRSQPKAKVSWAKPFLEQLEKRIVLNAALDGLKAGLPGLSTGLSDAFGQAASSLLSTSLPFAPLITSTVLSNGLQSVVNNVETAANSSSTVTELFGKTGSSFKAANLQEAGDGSSASFDLTITATTQGSHTLGVLTNQNINIGPFTVSLNPGPGAQLSLDETFTITTHVAVSAGGLSITAGTTGIQYQPTAHAGSVASVSGSVGGVTFSGTVGLTFSPTITATFQVGGTIAPSDLKNASPQAKINNTGATIPFQADVTFGNVGTFSYVSSLTYDLQSGFQSNAADNSQVLYTAPGSNTPVLLQQSNQPVDSDNLPIQTVLRVVAGPLFAKLGGVNGIIPQDLTEFLLGKTEIAPGLTISDLLGGTPDNPVGPIDILGQALNTVFTGSGTVISVVKTLLQAADFAGHLESNASATTLEDDAKALNVTFPILDQPLETIKDILAGTATPLVEWNIDMVKLLLEEFPAGLQAAEQLHLYDPNTGYFTVDFSQFGQNIAKRVFDALAQTGIASALGQDTVDILEKALSIYLKSLFPLSGSFSLYAKGTVGIDSTFLTDPSLGGVANSFFAKSGRLIDLKINNLGFNFNFSPSALALADCSDKSFASDPFGTAQSCAGDAGDGISNTAEKAAKSAQEFFQQVGNDLNQLLQSIHAEFDLNMNGELTIDVPDGPTVPDTSPGELKAGEALDIFNNDPECLLIVNGRFVPHIHAEASVGPINPGPYDSGDSFAFSFGNDCTDTGGGHTGGGNNTGVQVNNNYFAETYQPDPGSPDLVLRVYGSSGTDDILATTDAQGRIVVYRNQSGLAFDATHITGILVILTNGSRAPANPLSLPGSPPADGGNDKVIFSSSLSSDLSVTVLGGSGNDYISAFDGPNDFFGGNVEFHGGDGNDTLYGGAGETRLYGDNNDDVLYAGTGYCELYGGAGDDILRGIPASSGVASTSSGGFMVGGTGEDVLSVGKLSQGQWIMVGGDANGADTDVNFLFGGSGNDLLIGGNYVPVPGGLVAGDLTTGGGALVLGGGGNDTIYGTGGSDVLIGGLFNASSTNAGNDVIYGGNSADGLLLGNVTVDATNHFIPDQAFTGSGTAVGGAGNDTIYAGNGDSHLEGDAGDDVFQVVNPAAGGVLAANHTITVDGGGQANDELDVRGGGGSDFSQTYQVGPAADAGSLVTTNQSVTQTINFTGIVLGLAETVQLHGLDVLGTAGGDSISVQDSDHTLGVATSVVQITGFTPVFFSDVNQLGIHGQGGADSITLNALAPEASLAKVVLDGGAAADQIFVQGTAVPTEVFGGQGDDTVTVSNSAHTLNDIGAVVTVHGGDGTAESGNTLDVIDTGATPGHLYGLTGAVVSRSGAFNINYDTFGVLEIDGGKGGNTFDLMGTAAGTTTTVNAGPGDDVIHVSSDAPADAGTLDGLKGPLEIDGQAGSNTLTISEGGSTTGDVVKLTSSQVVSAVVPFTIGYQATGGTFAGGIHLVTGSGDDAVNVQSTRADSPTTVNTGAGNDTINVSSDAAGNGRVLTNGGDLLGIAGALSIDAGGGTGNWLVVSNFGGGPTNNVVLTNNAILNFAPATITYAATGGSFKDDPVSYGIVLRGSSKGGDTVNVRSAFLGSTTWLQGSGGNDTFNVIADRQSAYALFASGTGANNHLNVADAAGGAVIHDHVLGAGFGTVQVAYLVGASSFIDYQGMAQVVTDPDAEHSFVQALYHQFLNRDASRAELDGWVLYAHLTHSQGAVADAIKRSPEARTLLVKGWYTKYLGRPAHAGEEQGWVASLLAGATEEVVLSTLLNSREYYAKAGFSDAVFIQDVFRDVLGRTANDQEVFEWEFSLRGTAGRGGTAWLILNSIEYRTDVINNLYGRALGRDLAIPTTSRFHDLLVRTAPSSLDVTDWVYSRLDLTSLAVAFASTKEFFDWAV